MHVYHPGREKQEDVFGTGANWVLVLLLGIVLVWGHVRYYEQNQSNAQKRLELQELREELEEKQHAREQQNLEAQAQEMGMYKPTPEEYHIIYVE